MQSLMMQNRSLTVFSFANCKVSDHFAKPLGNGLYNNIKLSVLNLGFNFIGDDGVIIIAHAIASRVITEMKELLLNNNNIGDRGGI